jgi:hypothetical protein
MKRALVVTVSMATLALFMTLPASASSQPRWDMTGTYTIQYFLGSGEYDHSDTITVFSYSDPGTFGGTGFYVPWGPDPTEDITGTLSGSSLTFDVVYRATSPDPGYTVHGVGTIATDGSLSGTADGPGQSFTWTAVGKARPFGYTTAADCVAPSNFVSSLGGTTTLTTTPRHRYEVTASGTYYAGGTSTFDIRADAEYSQDTYQFANGIDWSDSVHGYEGYGEQLLDLEVDGQNVDWGTYSSSHTYTASFVAPDSSTSFAFDIYDTYAANNTGGLCVSLTDVTPILTGFFAPIDMNDGLVNVAKAGQAIPVKWRLTDHLGNPVDDLTLGSDTLKGDVKLAWTGSACDNGIVPDAIEVYASGGSGLQYLGDGNWQLNWKTPKTLAGHCGSLILTIYDDPALTLQAGFRFVK